MTATHPQLHPPHDRRPGTVRALLRLRAYARPAIPWILAGMGASLTAQLVALSIPQVLQAIVDGPLSDGDAASVVPWRCSCSGSACSRRCSSRSGGGSS